MKPYIVAAALIASAFAAACSDENSSKPAEPAAVSAGAAAGKVAINTGIPREIDGLPFAVGGKCAIDSVNKPQQGEVISMNRSDGMTVDGWAFDDQKQSVPRVLVLQLASGNSRFHALLSRHGGREDLVISFGKPEYSEAGYSGVIDIGSLAAGKYEILVIQKTLTKNLVCSTYRKLVINE